MPKCVFTKNQLHRSLRLSFTTNSLRQSEVTQQTVVTQNRDLPGKLLHAALRSQNVNFSGSIWTTASEYWIRLLPCQPNLILTDVTLTKFLEIEDILKLIEIFANLYSFLTL